MFDFEYRITLPKSEKIMKARSGQTKGNYKLTDLHLEYEVIESEDLAREVRDKYTIGRSLGFDYTTLLKTLSKTTSDRRQHSVKKFKSDRSVVFASGTKRQRTLSVSKFNERQRYRRRNSKRLIQRRIEETRYVFGSETIFRQRIGHVVRHFGKILQRQVCVRRRF